MTRGMKRWRKADGSIKLLQIRSPASYDKTLQELIPYMEFLGIPRDKWRMASVSGSHEGHVGLAFKHNGVNYLITSERQTRSGGKPSVKDNARAILHIIQGRVREMRKGVETVESAFGGFVNWLNTPQLPEKMERELRQRGIELMLPAPRKNQKQLED
ncbi:hypothetical protein ES703_125818 [subsurface metagenome]